MTLKERDCSSTGFADYLESSAVTQFVFAETAGDETGRRSVMFALLVLVHEQPCRAKAHLLQPRLGEVRMVKWV